MSMTSKERIKACVEMQPVDRLPFWPKLDAVYPAKWGGTIGGHHANTGTDSFAWIYPTYKEIRKNTQFTTESKDGYYKGSYITPLGTLTERKQYDAESCSWHPTEHPIKTKQDIEIMAYWYRDAEVVFCEESYEKSRLLSDSVGDRGFTFECQGESALMDFVEWMAGIEQAHFLLEDYPDEIEELFHEIHRVILKRFEISIEHSVADTLYLSENTSTTIISPEQYIKYCFPHIKEYGELVGQTDRKLTLHMCGHLKKILPVLNELPASIAAFEAFTSPTVGNTTLYDGRTACPGKCLIGGTNAIVWLLTAKEIIAYFEEQLDILPHHRGIVLSSGGVMPPLCSPETIKEVNDWIGSYNARF